jgi:hypothetical protein
VQPIFHQSLADGRQKKRHPQVPFYRAFEAVLTVANVHGNFKTETHFSSSWLGPHGISPVIVVELFYEMTIQIIPSPSEIPVCTVMNNG